MKRLIAFLLTVTLLLGSATLAGATLWDRGGGLIYDDVLDVTWLQDANYARTSGYDDNGRMTWHEAMDWAENLTYHDEVRGVNWEDWRLPHALPVNGTEYDYTYSDDGSTDRGYNISAPGSMYPQSTANELAFMYYNNLGNVAHGGLQNVTFESGGQGGPIVSFYNLEEAFYYTSSEYQAPGQPP